jgi:hypothetical protein
MLFNTQLSMAGPDPAIQILDGRLKGGHGEKLCIFSTKIWARGK